MTEDGQFVFFTIQTRRIAISPWLKMEPIEPVEKVEEWYFASNDYFSFKDDDHSVWSLTGSHGWWDKEKAQDGLNDLRNRDSKGNFDATNLYHKHCQSIRHEFRLVKITMSKRTDVVY